MSIIKPGNNAEGIGEKKVSPVMKGYETQIGTEIDRLQTWVQWLSTLETDDALIMLAGIEDRLNRLRLYAGDAKRAIKSKKLYEGGYDQENLEQTKRYVSGLVQRGPDIMLTDAEYQEFCRYVSVAQDMNKINMFYTIEPLATLRITAHTAQGLRRIQIKVFPDEAGGVGHWQGYYTEQFSDVSLDEHYKNL